MSDVVIQVEGLGKKYRLGQVHSNLLSERLGNVFRKFCRGLSRGSHSSRSSAPLPVDREEELWALKDVSFEVERGKVVGIIGSNGAGKSTLLKILSRITSPTVGLVEMLGRVASLLEVGTGFHPELTGRENIYLNGAILGMSKAEIRDKFDEIVSFAEIEKFIDTPVKRYSSGMYVRLAFAVAAHLEPEILIVDEVLAVGDAAFQKKCTGKIQDIAGYGRTVLFVSHNMGMITSLCDSCILLQNGQIKTVGRPAEVVVDYFRNAKDISKWAFRGDLAADIMIEQIFINGSPAGGQAQVIPSENIVIKVRGRCGKGLSDVKIALTLSIQGVRICTFWDTPEFTPLAAGKFDSVFAIPQYIFRPGEYTIGIGGDRQRSGGWFYGDNLCLLQVVEQWDGNCRKDDRGIINMRQFGVKSERIVNGIPTD